MGRRVFWPCASLPPVVVAHDYYAGVILFVAIIVLMVFTTAISVPQLADIKAPAVTENPTALQHLDSFIAGNYAGLTAVTVLLGILTEVFLVMVVIGDPGVVPDGTAGQEFAQGEAIDFSSVSDAQALLPIGTDAHMCPQCKIEVENYDHHCSIIGACIGRRTMPWFMVMLFVGALAQVCGVIVNGLVVARMALSGHLLQMYHDKTLPGIDVLIPPGTGIFMLWLGGYTAGLCFVFVLHALRGQHTIEARRRWKAKKQKAFPPLPPHRMSNLMAVMKDLKLYRLAEAEDSTAV